MSFFDVTNVWYALLAPLIGFLWCAFFGRVWPRLAGWIASIAVGIAFVFAVSAYAGLSTLQATDRIRAGDLYTWIASTGGPGAFQVPFKVYFDPLSSVMILIVTGVAFLIHVYATAYMKNPVAVPEIVPAGAGRRASHVGAPGHGVHRRVVEALEPRYGRFFAYMNLFVLSMLILVLAGNFLLLMVGWAGVGVCSYLLISFYFERPDAAAAGVKAFVVNAIGDAGLILAAALILVTFKSLDYATVFSNARATLPVGGSTVTWITLLLLVAAVAKSAQLPLYTWLPDAMAGPTPVSALIHAATMVTAGVYLIARASPLFTLAPFTMSLIAWIGAITALFAATIGLVKPNIKRVLAYSTVSQLGYMFLAVGLGGFAAGIFHLMTHAFFKGLLFLGAGAVIHALHGEEDMRAMGGLRRQLPVVFWTFLPAALAISGVVPFAGFFSKDQIISLAFNAPGGNVVLGVLALFTAFLTSVYIFRLVFMTFFGKSRVAPEILEHFHPPGPAMTIPLAILAVMSTIGGLFPWTTGGFGTFLGPTFEYYKVAPGAEGGLNVPLAAVSLALSLLGIGLAWFIWGAQPQRAESLGKSFGGVRQILLNDYGIDRLYGAVFVGGARALGRLAAYVIDPDLIDGVIRGLSRLVALVGEALTWIESGYVRWYATAILVGAVVVVAATMALGGR